MPHEVEGVMTVKGSRFTVNDFRRTRITRVKRILYAVWEAFRYLFLTPNWGSKRRAEQREYERMLEEKGEE